MTEYLFPNVGRIIVERKGEVKPTFPGGGLRYRFDVSAPVRKERVHTWITVPENMLDETTVLSLACSAIGYKYAEITGDDTGSVWDIYAEDLDLGQETAPMYRVSGVSHYRTTPYTKNRAGETYATIRDAVDGLKMSAMLSLATPGDVVDLYPNDSDEPSHRLTVGPREGVTVRRFT